MRRVLHWLSILSLALAVFTAFIWIRSYYAPGYKFFGVQEAAPRHAWRVSVYRGILSVDEVRIGFLFQSQRDCALRIFPVISALLVLPALRLWVWWKGDPAIPRQCPACGYDLRATPDRCPECGKVVEKVI